MCDVISQGMRIDDVLCCINKDQSLGNEDIGRDWWCLVILVVRMQSDVGCGVWLHGGEFRRQHGVA